MNIKDSCVYAKKELVAGKRKAIFPRAFIFKVEPADPGFYIDCEELNIRVYSDYEETMWEKVFDELITQYCIYANEDPTLLTEDAKKVRENLKQMIINTDGDENI